MALNKNDNNTFDINDPYLEDIKSKSNFSFDFALWAYRILKYWYLFAISLVIAFGLAKLKNKSWVASYMIESQIMLDDRSSVSIVANAVPKSIFLQNSNNQQIVLKSYDLAKRTITKLPLKLHVNYYRNSRFKQLSLYSYTPVEIEIVSLEDEAYNFQYNVAYVDESKCRLFYEGDETTPAFSMTVPYNEEIIDTNKRFKIKLKKTHNYIAVYQPFTFYFLNDDQLLNSFYGRIVSSMKKEDASVLSISMFGPDPGRDKDYMNVLLSEFLNYNLVLKNQQADSTLSFIDKQLIIINDSMRVSRSNLDNFQAETGLYQASSSSLSTDIEKAQTEEEVLNLKERNILVVTKKIADGVKSNTPLIDPAKFNVSNPRLTQYINEYNQLLERYLFLGTQNPIYNKTVGELNELRTKILEEVQWEVTTIQEEKDILADKYDVLKLTIGNLPPQERELLEYQKKSRLNEMYYTFLTQRKYEAQIQRASNAPDNFILEEPRVLGGPTNSNDTSNRTSFFLVIGAIIPLIFVVLKEEVLKNKISTKEDCERISGLPVIGTIENVGKKLKNGTVLVRNYPKSSFAESFRNIRVRLEYMAQRETKISVLITSTEPADGKTFIATNVASVYQLTGKKVVIVDLDLRRPSVSKTLNIETTKGVSNYIIGQVTLDEVIIKNSDFGFDVIGAGTLPPNPSELIKTAKTKELIEILKERYDYVIIDCSPIGLVSDAYILSRYVDTTLFVVRRNKTSKSFLKSVTSQLRFDNVGNVSIIFNDVKGREGYYGTARYYGDKTYYLKKSNYYHDDYFEN